VKTNSDAIEERIATVLKAFPQVRAGWLFGSTARGRARADSDLDVAVVSTVPRAGFPLREAHTAFVEAGIDHVDLAILDQGDLVLRFEAVRQNRLIFARPDFSSGEYFSRTVREFFDFEPLLRRQREALRERYGATRTHPAAADTR